MFFKKPSIIMLELFYERPLIVTEIARKTNFAYSYVETVIQKLAEMGLVTFKKHGRSKKVDLTPKGVRIAGEIKKIVEVLHRVQDK